MDQLLPQLLSFPPHPPPKIPLSDSEYNKQIRALIEVLNAKSASLLVNGVKGGGDLLDILDPSINSLPYLYALLAHIRNAAGKNKKEAMLDRFAPGTALWAKMAIFMQAFDPIQIRYAGHELRRLTEYIILSASQTQKPASAIPSLQSAILRVDPSGSTLTSSHVQLVTFCLQSQEYASALPVLDKDIYYLPPSMDRQANAAAKPFSPFLCSNHASSSTYITPTSGLSARLQYHDYLEYFLYGAMIYMRLKMWSRAQSFLEIAVSCPTANVASKIQVESYKKLILVGLLRTGRLVSAPKTTNLQAVKLYNSLANPYIALAKIFQEGIENEESSQRLLAEVQYGHAIWQEDSNTGLVTLVVQAYLQFSILHLEATYAALTVAEVARQTSPDPKDVDETGRYLGLLIETGSLQASISKPSSDPRMWVLRFSTAAGLGGHNRSEQQQLLDLNQQTDKIRVLMQHVREADRQLGISREYVQEIKRSRATKADGLGGGEAIPSSMLGAFEHDEDMMVDI